MATPMVLGAMDMVLNSDFANSAFCTLVTDDFLAGTVLIEAVFKLNCSPPKHLQVMRYLSSVIFTC